MANRDSGRLANQRRRRKEKPDDRRTLAVRGYAHAVMVLDGGASPQDLAAEIMRNGVEPVDAMTGLIFAVRDVLRLRGWLRDAPIVVDQPAHLESWKPRLTDDPPRIRLVLDLERIDVPQVAALWTAQRERLQVTLRLLSRQLALGEAPAAQDLEALMAGHDNGLHDERPDWACPACLLRAAEERLAEQVEPGADEETGEPPAEPGPAEGPPPAPQEGT